MNDIKKFLYFGTYSAQNLRYLLVLLNNLLI